MVIVIVVIVTAIVIILSVIVIVRIPCLPFRPHGWQKSMQLS